MNHTIYGYIDGKFNNRMLNITNDSIGINSAPLSLGLRTNWDYSISTIRDFNGSIDYAMIWNRTLSDIEIYHLNKTNNNKFNYTLNFTEMSFQLENVLWVNETLMYGEIGTSIRKSLDNGSTWTTFLTGLDSTMLFRSSKGNLYIHNATSGNFTIYNETDGSSTEVEVWSVDSSNILNEQGITESHNGSIIVGEYGTNNSVIWVSGDDGLTWNMAYNGSARVGSVGRHIHFVQCSPYSPYKCYASEG